MKRCPQCNRLEPDDTLGYCRADGTALISDSGPVSAEAGTVKVASAPVSSEIETSVLPQMITAAGISRPTSQTTVFPTLLPPENTRELSKPKRRKAIVAMAAVIAVALIAGACLYWLNRFRSKNIAPIESIAVMPFINGSSNADIEYLADGMAETLINSLSQLPKLSVKARSSVFRYKSKEVDPQTVGTELNVQAIYKDQAFAWLDKADKDHDQFLPRLKVDPRFDNLRSDPRFQDLLRRSRLGQ